MGGIEPPMRHLTIHFGVKSISTHIHSFQAKINCIDNGDGSADVDYIPTAEGEYAVHILCDKEDIPGSPYMAQVTWILYLQNLGFISFTPLSYRFQILPPTDYEPDKVKAFGPGLENGVNPKEVTHFTVDTTEAGKDI